jgi:plasmid stabilization system protein ParE
MGNEFILLPKAASDLESIFQYISIERQNPESALSLIAKFKSKFNDLTLFPKAFPIIDNDALIHRHLRKCSVDQYLVVYFFDEPNHLIVIIRVIYVRQDLYRLI